MKLSRARYTEDRFWLTFSPEPNTGCWLWLGAIAPGARAKCSYQGKPWVVSRLAYTLAKGPIPAGMFVCHSCDNGDIGCGNPDHLWVGTPKENTHDALRKGRWATGSRQGSHTHPEKYAKGAEHANAKLTADQVREIRRRYTSERGCGARLAREYGVSSTVVYQVRSGQKYASVA
jgi:hypothetical protein